MQLTVCVRTSTADREEGGEGEIAEPGVESVQASSKQYRVSNTSQDRALHSCPEVSIKKKSKKVGT